MQYNATAAVYWRIHRIFQNPPDSFIPMGIEELLHRRTWRGALALHHSPTARRAVVAPRAAAPVPCLLAAAAPPAATASGCPSRGSFSSSRGAQVNTTPLLLRSARRVPPRELRHRELGASGSRSSVRRCREHGRLQAGPAPLPPLQRAVVLLLHAAAGSTGEETVGGAARWGSPQPPLRLPPHSLPPM
jgi:hypothetical protein